jgi:nuclear pore complex protein Nup62
MSFSFGQPASSSGSSPGLFGSAAPKPDANSGSGLFGNANKAPTTAGFSFGNAAAPTSAGQTSSPFGAPSPSTQTPTTSSFSFGQKPAAQSSNPTTPGVAATGNPFGGAAASTGGFSLGNTSTTPAATNKPMFSTTPAGPPPTQSTGGLFGGGGGAKPLFGQPEQKPADAPKSTPTFGAPLSGGGAAPPSNNAFGSFGKKPDDSTSASAPPTSMFGQKPAEGAAPANKPMFNLGGAVSSTPQSAPAAQSGFSLGGNSSKPAFSLGGNTSQAPASATTTSAPSMFGAMGAPSSTAAPASTGASTPSMFGAKKDDAASKPAAPAGNMFGGLGQNKDADKPASSPSLFAPAQNKDDATKPAAPAGNLFGGLGAKKDDAVKPASPAGGLFGNLGGQKKDDTAAPTSTTPTSGSAPAFSLGAKPTDSSTPASTGGSAFGLKPAAAPAAGGAGGNGGNGGGPPTIAAAPAAGPNNGGNNGPLGSNATGGLGSGPTGSNTTGGLGSNLANASTSGPAPPATSRLNSKSLDEIITLWTTSLSSHQKQFSNLANKIGSWDRMLVENSDKISKLYSRTFQAERDTAEVERQLSSVEGQQEELSHWLDHYERVLNDMAAKAGGVDSGVDAERERTYVHSDSPLQEHKANHGHSYQTAERCSARLTTMSHDLTSMIDEINLASTNLSKSSKTAESDPLSQIVRVLNAHLGQLQQIDVGAEQLRQKVESAQKEVRGFGGRVGDEGGVEGFMRSLRR